MPSKRPSLAEMVAKAGGRDGRSPVQVWLKKNYRDIRNLFDATGPNWPGLLKVMHQQGVTDQNGNPPALRTAQQHWYRLCGQMAARPPPPRPRQPVPQPDPGEVARGVRPLSVLALPAQVPPAAVSGPDADPLAALLAQINKH